MNTIDWKNATPEQVTNWKIASALIAYTTITPLSFVGALAGSEFLTYNIGKLYFCFELDASSNYPHSEVELNLFNIANVLSYNFPNFAAAGQGQIAHGLRNIYFSRLECNTGTPFIKFIGYKLTV